MELKQVMHAYQVMLDEPAGNDTTMATIGSVGGLVSAHESLKSREDFFSYRNSYDEDYSDEKEPLEDEREERLRDILTEEYVSFLMIGLF